MSLASTFAALAAQEQAWDSAVSPGTVTIAGVRFDCAVSLGPITPQLQEDGINYRNEQQVSFSISKTALPAAPAPRSEVTIGDLIFRVVNTGPQDEYEPAWHITARRYA